MNTATANPRFVTVSGRQGDPEVHRANCNDLPRNRFRATGQGNTPEDAAVDNWSDFVESGEMTEAEASACCRFLPCCFDGNA